ncbi:MAG: sulfur carrier protein ThiS [Deltaproteobacteria bacterium]|nr:sulfur carrier protein ThiS [Deltaproteobacteria bacterium]
MARINITLNDKDYTFESDIMNIVELLNKIDLKPEGIAVCVNGEIVKKRDYLNFTLKEGDRVDIITMVGGG